jgi:hypothetical protein
MASNEFTFTGDTVALNAWLMGKCQPGLKYSVKVTKWQKKRTLDQSAQSFVWYQQLEHELPEDNAQGWRRFCKLHFGVPILRAHDNDFRMLYDKCIRQSLSYEEKLIAMDVLPVTSRMNTETFNLYFTALQDHFDTQGVRLEFLR